MKNVESLPQDDNNPPTATHLATSHVAIRRVQTWFEFIRTNLSFKYTRTYLSFTNTSLMSVKVTEGLYRHGLKQRT